MTAEIIAKALGGRKVGPNWMALCPAHNDQDPSLSIRGAGDGKVLVHCHAGCEQAKLIAALQDRGLWPTYDRHHHPQPRQPAPGQRDRGDAERTARAQRLWHQARPGGGTNVESYLQGRGIALETWPETLRYHPSCFRPRDEEGNLVPQMPAMVARVEHVQRGAVGIHVTYLRPDGSGKADIPKRQQKACFGPVGGGAVRLGIARPDQWLVVGEGIETTLSAVVSCGFPGWAALSEGGMRALMLPPEAAMVLICADNDASGTGQRAARDAAERFLREGRRVRIAMPPVGTDFNDILNSDGKEARYAA
jgi:putative DNA primase/helicase